MTKLGTVCYVYAMHNSFSPLLIRNILTLAPDCLIIFIVISCHVNYFAYLPLWPSIQSNRFPHSRKVAWFKKVMFRLQLHFISETFLIMDRGCKQTYCLGFNSTSLPVLECNPLIWMEWGLVLCLYVILMDKKLILIMVQVQALLDKNWIPKYFAQVQFRGILATKYSSYIRRSSFSM